VGPKNNNNNKVNVNNGVSYHHATINLNLG
jgi:hypothetical protein